MPALDVTAQSLAVLDYDPTIPEIHSANCSRKHDTSASCSGMEKKSASKAAFTHEEFETLVNASVPRTRTPPKRATPKAKENTLAQAFALHATPEKIAALRLMQEASAAGKKKEKKKMPVKAAKTPEKKNAERYSAEKIAAVEARARAMALERYASADKKAAVRAGLEAREHASPEKMAAVRAGLKARAEAAAAAAAKMEKVASVRLILEAAEPLVAMQSRTNERMASASGFQHYTEDVSHLIQ
jgi:hypothetical protein